MDTLAARHLDRADADADAAPPRAKRHRVSEAPSKWSELPADRLTFCIGVRDATAAVDLIQSAARCPALTAYDLRWRRHAGQRPCESRPDVQLRHALLSNQNDAPVPLWPGLRVQLSERQRRSMRWMLSKEAGTDDELVVERGCQDSRFSTHRGIDFQVRLSFTLRGGILADAMSYGKTLLAIGLIAASVAQPLPGRNGRPPCGVSLILVPENLVYQWLCEFRKALGALVQLRFFGADNLLGCDGHEPTVLDGAGVDGDIGEAGGTADRSQGRACVYAAANLDGWAAMLQESWTDALALVVPYSLLRAVDPWFILHRFHWRRVVIDELHEALACQTMAGALGLVSAQHVWGLSGTLPTSTTGDVARLAELFGVSMPIDAINASRFLDCYVRRNSAQPADDVAVDEHVVLVRPTSMERAIYLACQHDFDDASGPQALSGYVPPFLSTWRGLQEHGREAALVKLSCHHQVTSTDVELLSTPDQSVERLCVWKRHHCEEARRLVRQHAALWVWMRRNKHAEGASPLTNILEDVPPRPDVGASDQEAWDKAAEDLAALDSMAGSTLYAECSKDLEAMPFALCDQPAEAETRWLQWCNATGIDPGTRGAISRLRKIMYDELWGRLVDGIDGWTALAKMSSTRDWRADYALAERSRLLEAVADFASSLRSLRFLERVVRQATAAPRDLECGVCLQPVCEPRITPCAHVFCAGCIARCLDGKAECPQCRAHIRGPGQLSELMGSRTGGEGSGAPAAAAESEAAVAAPSCAGDFDGAPVTAIEAEFGSKIAALVRRLQIIVRAGEKAVVFAQWQDLIFKIHSALIKFQVPAEVLGGGAFDRASALQRFESPELPVLLLSLEDSASGTNMAHASHVLLVHPMVAASAEEQRAGEAQAIGRVKRWGQRRRVQVWRFVMEGTLEADLAARQADDGA
eukprot:TRINITY_DN5042_c1_g1_i1.p1 TRINITY_DN5042_c1_g1~~TRINITY_DN5042_c1_g1_i1.p1  ORF type:complete len:925 (+),score=183.77 TRINITY_DN5042_c1_g1_i1:52-2826(+)